MLPRARVSAAAAAAAAVAARKATFLRLKRNERKKEDENGRKRRVAMNKRTIRIQMLAYVPGCRLARNATHQYIIGVSMWEPAYERIPFETFPLVGVASVGFVHFSVA